MASSDYVLVGVVKNGLKPYAGEDYESDMPAFAGSLSDQEIEAVVAYIKSTWPQHEREYQDAVTRRSRCKGNRDKSQAVEFPLTSQSLGVLGVHILLGLRRPSTAQNAQSQRRCGRGPLAEPRARL